MTNHRFFQLYELADRASHERVAYYCRAIKAAQIGNNGAARWFTQKAQQWDRIRQTAQRRVMQ
jgi:hypothetical protein